MFGSMCKLRVCGKDPFLKWIISHGSFNPNDIWQFRKWPPNDSCAIAAFLRRSRHQGNFDGKKKAQRIPIIFYIKKICDGLGYLSMYVATMTTNMNNENVISLLFPMGIIVPFL